MLFPLQEEVTGTGLDYLTTEEGLLLFMLHIINGLINCYFSDCRLLTPCRLEVYLVDSCGIDIQDTLFLLFVQDSKDLFEPLGGPS